VIPNKHRGRDRVQGEIGPPRAVGPHSLSRTSGIKFAACGNGARSYTSQWRCVESRGTTMQPSQTAGANSAADLVRRIVHGEMGAEEELIRRYSQGVSVIINRISGNCSIAEDLCQETFQLALEKIRNGEVREPERLSGFICGLARNLVIDYFRRASRQSPSQASEAAAQLRQRSPNQLDRLLEEEKAEIVRQVLSDLTSERDRQVLHRFYIAEDDKDEICADLELSSLHFNRVLFRARERYKELYERFVCPALGK
jgi:RNA polymerase sigma-70 factor (ECF subfamily)